MTSISYVTYSTMITHLARRLQEDDTLAGFIISIAYLLIVMTIESNIDLTQDNYHTKLIGFAIGGLIISLVCFYDDIKGAKAIVKLIAQIIAAIVVVKSGLIIDSIDIPFFRIESENECCDP